MRKAAAPAFVGAVVILVLAGAAVRAARGAGPRREEVTKTRPTDETIPVGYWVWQRIEAPDGATEIAPADLVAQVGPEGWPGCPEHYLCTRHGIRSLAVGPSGAFHYTANVFTSSDFQHHGSVSDDEVRIEERFSCAHPGWRSRPRERRRVRWAHDDKTLRVAVDPSIRGGGWPFARAETGTWWVFRRVSRATYYGQALLRLCQATPSHACAPMCFSEDLVSDPSTP
ncbi:MAG: hypothetical protein KC619_20875 [Myxococcales bacterium]|nr:hypothetical protein [Myxococcales bacterium]